MHTIELKEMVLCPDHGLFLGNGDLSVSIYQKSGQIIWRFGKGDVWDRRHDLSEDPRPAHINEVADGILNEGWECGPYGGPVIAKKGSKNPARMKEICQGCPPSYECKPFPCPKPVGELALNLPPDSMGLKISQRLVIEEAKLYIECSWNSGESLALECFVPPSANVLCIRWERKNGRNMDKEIEAEFPPNRHSPVWFSLYRWADPVAGDFNARYYGDYYSQILGGGISGDTSADTLPLPVVHEDGNLIFIEQTFFPDPIFLDGFRYLLAPLGQGMMFKKVDMGSTGEARLHILPEMRSTSGLLAIGVTTGADHGGALQELQRLKLIFTGNPEEVHEILSGETNRSVREFWSKSKVSISDPLLENLWYETLHAARSIYRANTVPPGLFFPSTVKDYSHWHGDYHTNYNFQQPFWGYFTGNHLELVDAYFAGIKFLLDIGRKIAKDYYNCRGAFIQLSGYPIIAEDDTIGTVPMGRMAYMTGWAMSMYWWRFLHTKDIDWLRNDGYPVIRDCALFYTDFLKKGDDGLYHAFPSNQGEDGFTGDPKDFADREQIMQHARYCLRAAIKASEVLNCDDGLRLEWYERLTYCAGDDGKPPLELNGLDKACYESNPPEFGFGHPYTVHNEDLEKVELPGSTIDLFESFGERLKRMNNSHFPWNLSTWYFGKYPFFLMRQLRAGEFIAGRDFPVFHRMIEQWRRPNGLLPAMSAANYGHGGGWTESLGILAPLQEMMLQSWDGALRIFPAWPKWLDARFENLRAEGAFLVSAAWSGGEVADLGIYSEKGGNCYFYSPWKSGAEILDEEGKCVEVIKDEYGRDGFQTGEGKKYLIKKTSK